MKLERRAVEFRQDAPGILTGVVVPYGEASLIAGIFRETVQRGALTWPDGVLANVQHDRARPLARLGHGLVLQDGRTALRATVTLPDTSEGRDVRALVEAGVMTGLSAEIRVTSEDWPEPDVRIIRTAELRGLAVVDDPAHTGSVIDEVRARMASDGGERRQRRLWL